MKSISIRLSDQAEKQLNWLIKELNRGSDVEHTITGIITTAIHNEWVDYNISLIDCEDDLYCDPDYLKGRTGKEIRELWGRT